MSNIGRKFNIITLCGSMRFKEEFLKVKEKLTLERNIVLTPNFFNNIKGKITTEMKKTLDEMHRQKIEMSNEVFVINVNGYIGESTKSEIEYAIANRKKVKYLEKI